jgi:hypothetical protein
MVLTKLYQKNKESINRCIKLTTQEKLRNYEDFEKNLEEKLRESEN